MHRGSLAMKEGTEKSDGWGEQNCKPHKESSFKKQNFCKIIQEHWGHSISRSSSTVIFLSLKKSWASCLQYVLSDIVYRR
jgi:hypothetical protein